MEIRLLSQDIRSQRFSIGWDSNIFMSSAREGQPYKLACREVSVESITQAKQSTQALKLEIKQRIILFLLPIIRDMREKMVLYLIFKFLIIFEVGDSLNEHVGMKFSTYDADNDLDNTLNCAAYFTGGWWYAHCHVCIFYLFFNM